MIFIGMSTWTCCYALWSSLAFPHEPAATLYDLHWHFHMNWMLRSMIFKVTLTWTWCYALWSSFAIPHELDATLYDLQVPFHTSLVTIHTGQDPHGSRWWLLESPPADHPWNFAIEKVPGTQSSNMEMHALFPVAVGVRREKPDGSHRWHVEENVRKSCGCPFSGWSHGRVVIHKVDGPFFGEVFNERKRSSLWRNIHFHHFRGPATLPPGSFSSVSNLIMIIGLTCLSFIA